MSFTDPSGGASTIGLLGLPAHELPMLSELSACYTVNGPFWLPLQLPTPVYLGDAFPPPPGVDLASSQLMKQEILLFRNKGNRPLRGQLWPLTR